MAAGGPDVVVVGAGIAGCMLAYELAGCGARVTVLDRAGIGGEAAKAAAGILAPTIESEGPGPFLDLALDSIRRFPPLAAALREATGEDVELVRAGALRVAFDEADEATVRAALPWQRATGSDARWLDRDEALALEPGLAPELRGAALCPDEYHVNSARLLHALALAAARRGVAFRTGTPALGLLHAGDRATGLRLPDEALPAGAVVLAGGAWTGAWAGELGAPLPVGPVRGQILVFRAPAPPLARIVFGPHGYLVVKPGGAVVAGTTEDRAGFATDVTAGGIATIARVGLPLVPAVAAATFDHAAAGLRPWSPDGLPLLGPAPGWRGVYVDSGHHRNGILLAPGSAALLADLLAGESGGERLVAFAPGRFAGDVARDEPRAGSAVTP